MRNRNDLFAAIEAKISNQDKEKTAIVLILSQVLHYQINSLTEVVLDKDTIKLLVPDVVKSEARQQSAFIIETVNSHPDTTTVYARIT